MNISDDATIHRAELLPCGDAAAMQRVDMLRSTPGYACFDTLHVQLQGLLQTRRPSQPLSRDALVAEADAFLRERPGYGTWVHYPWSRRLVRLLPEADFFDLRTSRNQLKITAAEQRSLAMRSIGIIGLSVGQSIAFTLAMERTCGELRLADFDTIELSNLNRLRCGVQHLGVNKAIVAAREIAELDPYLRVTCFVDGYNDVDADAFMTGLDLVVEECDSLDVKVAVREEARRRGIAVLMNTSDRGMTDIERFDLEPARPLFHGLVGLPPTDTLRCLNTAEKLPLVLSIIGGDTMTVRLRASMLEIGATLPTWPQLAADVMLGGALVTDVSRRLLLGEPVHSGRFFVDPSQVGAYPASDTNSTSTGFAKASDCGQPSPTHPLDAVIADACTAPSAGNVQPWQWQRAGDTLLLSLRPTQHASVLYHGDRANLLGLGGAAETARISAAARGVSGSIIVLHEGDKLVEPFEIGPANGRDELAAAIHTRRSDRRRTVSAPIEQARLQALHAEMRAFPHLRLALFEGLPLLAELAEVIGAGDRLRALDEACHRDMVDELCLSRSEHIASGEGICPESLGLAPAEASVVGLLREPAVVACLRETDLGTGLGTFAAQMIATAGAVGILWSLRASPVDYFDAGRAMQRLWLRATARGMGLCPVTPLAYLLAGRRAGAAISPLLESGLPDLEARFDALLGLPKGRTDLILFRIMSDLPPDYLPRTLRLPVERVVMPPSCRSFDIDQATTTRSRPSAFAR